MFDDPTFLSTVEKAYPEPTAFVEWSKIEKDIMVVPFVRITSQTCMGHQVERKLQRLGRGSGVEWAEESAGGGGTFEREIRSLLKGSKAVIETRSSHPPEATELLQTLAKALPMFPRALCLQITILVSTVYCQPADVAKMTIQSAEFRVPCLSLRCPSLLTDRSRRRGVAAWRALLGVRRVLLFGGAMAILLLVRAQEDERDWVVHQVKCVQAACRNLPVILALQGFSEAATTSIRREVRGSAEAFTLEQGKGLVHFYAAVKQITMRAGLARAGLT